MFEHLDSTVVAGLLVLGFFSGIWNAIAGGASFFTFPALMALGLPANIAHATSYVAVSPANLGSLLTAYRSLGSVGSQLGPMMIVTAVGAAIGSWLLVASDPEFFEALVPALVMIATLLFALGAAVRRRLVEMAGANGARIGGLTLLFAASIYGGYFGSGAGILLLALAQLLGYAAYPVANAIKNALAICFSVIGLVIFGAGGIVAWPEALLLLFSCAIGGMAGGVLSEYVNPLIFRRLIIAFGAGLSLYFAWTLWLGRTIF